MVNGFKNESTPHIRHVEHSAVDEDPPVVALRNQRYVASGNVREKRSVARQIMTMASIVVVVAVFWALVQMYLAEDLMSARSTHMMQRVVAGGFFLVVIFWFVIEAGWAGGAKDR